MPRATPRGVWFVLALTGLVLAAINVGAGRALDRVGSNLGYSLMDQKWSLLREPGEFDPRTVVLVLGDSSGNQGVDPVVLGEALGAGGQRPRVLNLCTVGDALTIHDAWMLSEWIELHGPPGEVVVVHTYDIWHREADGRPVAATLAGVPIPLWEWPRLRPALRMSWERWAVLLTSRWTPLYARDTSLRDMLADPAETWRRLTTGAGTMWQTVDENGYLSTSQARPEAVDRDTRGHLWFLRARTDEPTRFRLSNDNLAGLREVARLGQDHGFPVWLAAAPLHRGLWESPVMRAYHEDLQARLKQFDRRHPSLRIVLHEPVLFGPDQMQNADHVTETAATEYSRVLGEAIRRPRGPNQAP